MFMLHLIGFERILVAVILALKGQPYWFMKLKVVSSYFLTMYPKLSA